MSNAQFSQILLASLSPGLFHITLAPPPHTLHPLKGATSTQVMLITFNCLIFCRQGHPWGCHPSARECCKGKPGTSFIFFFSFLLVPSTTVLFTHFFVPLSVCQALYLELLVTELAKEGGDVSVRQAAGLAAKNALTAKVSHLLPPTLHCESFWI